MGFENRLKEALHCHVQVKKANNQKICHSNIQLIIPLLVLRPRYYDKVALLITTVGLLELGQIESAREIDISFGWMELMALMRQTLLIVLA